jgi:hypothetical protein
MSTEEAKWNIQRESPTNFSVPWYFQATPAKTTGNDASATLPLVSPDSNQNPHSKPKKKAMEVAQDVGVYNITWYI